MEIIFKLERVVLIIDILKNYLNSIKVKIIYSNLQLILLSILAGMFISIGATVFLQSLTLAIPENKLTGSIFFSIGLILVVMAKAELFTGNNLLIVGVLNKTLRLSQLIKNWVIVYLGNFIGCLFFAIMIKLSNLQILLPVQNIVTMKVSKTSIQLFTLGILCNMLVCLAVWMCNNQSEFIGKIFMIIFPIAAFVFCGFEHSIADMFYLCLNYLSSPSLTNIHSFIILIPVTLGNIVGGMLIGIMYWLSFKSKSYVSTTKFFI